MHWLDWAIIGLYVVVVTAIGIAFIKRASGSVAEYFVAGRNLPWWLAGTSLVATSFAADTPLFVAGLVATKGIAGNWLWWNQAVAWALAVVFFARLWRRAGLTTDAEFIELRYSGRAASFLRGFKAVYTSLIFSTCTLAWVMLAMQKIVTATLGRPAWAESLQASVEASLGAAPGSIDVWKWIVLLSLFGIATLYTVLSGFWGIVVTDLLQFVIAMIGAVVFAMMAVQSVGGMEDIKLRLLEQFGSDRAVAALNFLPESNSQWMPITTFAVFLGILWWGDCGGFAAQRMFSTRSEKDSTLTAIWYSIAHFALRPWPWIVVGLVAFLRYPGLEDPESGYPKLLMEILPAGIRGILIASLLAAFMSTVDTHLNWNASYFVTDIYRRFLVPSATERQCVRVARVSVLVYAALAIVVAYYMTSIEKAVLTLFNLQAGIGMVLMLRWLWWRVNAWSEISAMMASLIVTTALPYLDRRYGLELSGAQRILITVSICTPTWLLATFLTSPTHPAKLEAFYRRIRPVAYLWGPVARACPDVPRDRGVAGVVALWLGSALALYAVMFFVGKLVLLEYRDALLAGGVAILASVLVWCCARKRSPAGGSAPA
jgi:Na+/proline symporter